MNAALPGIDSDLFREFRNRLKTAAGRILLLDYDGTLAPFQIERENARPYPGVREALNDIAGSGASRLVIISGRNTESLLPLLGLEKTPEIWGSHGVERLFTDGRLEVMTLSERQQKAIAHAAEWANKELGGDRVEVKPSGVAVHWRGLSGHLVEELKQKAISRLAPLADGSEMEVHKFDGGLEMRVRGRNKGDAVRTIISESAPGSVVAYLGDDLTDEDAFKALKGVGLAVLVKNEWRPTEAQMWIRPPEELLRFLREWSGINR